MWISEAALGRYVSTMCNLYAIMEARAEVARMARAMTDRNNNQPPMSGVYPDYPAPVIVATEDAFTEISVGSGADVDLAVKAARLAARAFHQNAAG